MMPYRCTVLSRLYGQSVHKPEVVTSLVQRWAAYHSDSKSSKYVRKPMPRRMARRLVQLAGRPMLPPIPSEMAARCSHRKRSDVKQTSGEDSSELNLALAAHVRRRLANFSVMAIYHRVYCTIRAGFTTTNHMLLDDLHYKIYNNNVMKLVIKDTRLSSLEPLFVGPNAIVMANGFDKIAKIVQAQEKYPHLHLLACVAGPRILSAEECETIAKMPTDLPPAASTVALLQSMTGKLPHTLDMTNIQLTSILGARERDLGV